MSQTNKRRKHVREFADYLTPIGAIVVGALALVVDIFHAWEMSEKLRGLNLPWPAILQSVGILSLVVFAVWVVVQLNQGRKQLRVLKRSLPILFAKTAHLREYLCSKRLGDYRSHVRQVVTSLPGDDFVQRLQEYREKLARRAPDAFLSGHEAFVAEAIEELLTDLRSAVEALTAWHDFTLSVQFAAEVDSTEKNHIPLFAIYNNGVDKMRSELEKGYLAKGASIGAFSLQQPMSANPVKQHHYFPTLDAASGCHIQLNFPAMETFIGSLIVSAILDDDSPVGNLQIDCPREYGFSSDIGHMVECTAHALGALFAVCLFVRERCLDAMRLEAELTALNRLVHNLELDNKGLQQTARKVGLAEQQIKKLLLEKEEIGRQLADSETKRRESEADATTLRIEMERLRIDQAQKTNPPPANVSLQGGKTGKSLPPGTPNADKTERRRRRPGPLDS